MKKPEDAYLMTDLRQERKGRDVSLVNHACCSTCGMLAMEVADAAASD